MENKKGNRIIIILLSVVIILGVFIVLILTDTISLNGNKMSKEDALKVVVTSSDKVGRVSNGYPYCGDNMIYDEKDVIIDKNNISSHTASKDYKSLSEMKDDLKKFMSDELISKYIDDNNYIEKDSKLYCLSPHKGTILYDSENSNYSVKKITSDVIDAYGNLRTHSEGDEYNTSVSIKLKKVNNNWIITEYNIQK